MNLRSTIWLTVGATLLCGFQLPTPPQDARRAFEKAGAAAKARRIDEAILDYQQAVAIFPRYAEAWCELGKLQIEQKQPDAARKALHEAIASDPKYADPYLPLAALEYAGAHWNELVDVTGQLLQIDAIDYPQAWLLNAVGNYNNHGIAAAERSAREAERLDSQRRFPGSWRLLGQILAQRGDFAGAAEQFRAYLKAAPAAPDAATVREKLTQAEARAGISAEAEATPTFGSEVNLAMVRFRFQPPKGDPSRELRREDIEIRENGVARNVGLFEGPHGDQRQVPIEISLLFDCSASVDRVGVLDAKIFRETLLDPFPGVSLAIYGFSDELIRFTKPTRDPAQIKRAMDQIVVLPARGTPLFGSIADTLRDAGATGPNVVRLLVIFSDGESEALGDELRAREAEKAAEQSGTALFPVVLNKLGAFSSAPSISEFANLGDATGGRSLHGMMGNDVLPEILRALAKEIQDQYVAGFYMDSSGKPRPRNIRVSLRPGVKGKLYGGSRAVIF